MRKYFILSAVIFALLPFSKSFAQTSRPVAILIPGAGGVTPSDFLIRNRGRISGSGIEVKVTTSGSRAASIVREMKKQKRKVVIVAMSRGGLAAGSAISSGPKPDGLVLVSTMLKSVSARIGSPSRLPATLIVHHRHDQCHLTPPSGVGSFRNWAGGKARVSWINTDGRQRGRRCGPFGAHGFFRKDGAAISSIVSFIRSR